MSIPSVFSPIFPREEEFCSRNHSRACVQLSLQKKMWISYLSSEILGAHQRPFQNRPRGKLQLFSTASRFIPERIFLLVFSHARFHVSHFSTSPSDRKASPSSVDTASQRCARFLDNKQVSQAEILENYQALPFCSRVSKRQRARSRYSCEHFRDHHKVLCCSRVSMTT